ADNWSHLAACKSAPHRRYTLAMHRRQFLKQATMLAGLVLAKTKSTAQNTAASARVTFDPTQTIATHPDDFLGLGFEISSVARPGLLSARNSTYVQLVRTLGSHVVIRVGGNTSDYASYNPTATPLSSPEEQAGSIVNDAVLRDLGTFLQATNSRLIWGLNLGGLTGTGANRRPMKLTSATIENGIQEAKAVMAAVGPR